MAVETEQSLPLSEIPDLYLMVLGYRSHVETGGVETDVVDRSRVGIVVLQQLVASKVVDLDGLVVRTRGQALKLEIFSDSTQLYNLHWVSGMKLTLLMAPS